MTSATSGTWEQMDPRVVGLDGWRGLPTSVATSRARRRARPSRHADAMDAAPLTSFAVTPEARVRSAIMNWRAERARRDGVRAEAVLASATLEHVVARAPTTDRALRAVRGVGPRTMDAYGGEILRAVRAALA